MGRRRRGEKAASSRGSRASGFPESAADYLSLPLAFILITFLHISLGEQAPKIMAIRAAQPTALIVSLPLTIFYKVLWPFIWVLHKASDLMLRVIGVRAVRPGEQMPNEEELRLILAESAAGGELSRRERLMMENVLDLEEKVTRQVMVPRRDIVFSAPAGPPRKIWTSLPNRNTRGFRCATETSTG